MKPDEAEVIEEAIRSNNRGDELTTNVMNGVIRKVGHLFPGITRTWKKNDADSNVYYWHNTVIPEFRTMVPRQNPVNEEIRKPKLDLQFANMLTLIMLHKYDEASMSVTKLTHVMADAGIEWCKQKRDSLAGSNDSTLAYAIGYLHAILEERIS